MHSLAHFNTSRLLASRSCSLPIGLRHPEKIIVAYNVAAIDAAIIRLRSGGHTLVGLDCEWRPTYTKGQARPCIARDAYQQSQTTTEVVRQLPTPASPPTVPAYPQGRYPVALIQIAVPGMCVLAHVASARALGQELLSLLQDRSIVKARKDDAACQHTPPHRSCTHTRTRTYLHPYPHAYP